MTPRSGPAKLLVLALIATVSMAACAAAPAASFDPTGACTTDGSAPGAYPDLEAAVPKVYEGRAPDSLDSGRHCTPESLGALADAGIDEVRFAGGTWGFGAIRAAALVVFEATGLTPERVVDFYGASATVANRTEVLGTSTQTMAGRLVHRLDTKTGDRVQTVVVWAADVPDRVNVVLTNDLPDPKIEGAVAAFGEG